MGKKLFLFLIIILFSINVSATELLHYNFTDLIDYSGNSNTATNNGASSNGDYPVFNLSGDSSPNSFSFDGINDDIITGDTSTFKFLHGALDTSNFQSTISFRVKINNPDTQDKAMFFISTNEVGSGTIGLSFFFDDRSGSGLSRRLRYFIYSGGNGNIIDGDSANNGYPNDNDWHMITATYNQGLGSNNLKLYVDSVLNEQFTKTGNTPNTGDSTGPLKIAESNSAVNPFPFVGLMDEYHIYDVALNQTEIDNLYKCNELICVSGNNFFAFNNSFYPPDNHSFSRSYMNFSRDATLVNNTLNCSLVVNGNVTASNIYSNSTNESYYFNITFNESLVTPGEYNWSVSCFSNVTNETTNSSINLFYLDEVFPSISTNFVNNSFYFEDNLSAQFNFSDDFYLNSYNISIDGVEVASNDSLSGTTAQLNLSTSIIGLDPGTHILSVQLADGHTAHKIPDYAVSNGLFGDYLRYGWEDSQGESKSVRIKHSDGSVFDTFTTEKNVDRYTWSFEPSVKKDTYYFDIDADDDIRIIEDDSTYLGSWITFGNKWMDFDLYGENSSVKITRLGNNRVKVKISNIKNPDKQKYQSIGDLNIIEVNYTFYKVNATLTYQTAVFEGALTSLGLILETSDLLILNSSANLFWYNISKNVSRINVSDDIVLYGSSFLVTDVLTENVSWIWFFNISDYEFNISGMSEVIQMNITNCSAGDYIVLNYTIYDEEFQTISTGINASIENVLTITTPDFDESSYEFTINELSDNLLICLPNETLNVSSWILNALTKYTYEDHVEEFHYIDNFLLNNSVFPKIIKLYDLATDDSTSFVVTYQDENYIYVEGVVVDLLRQYTSLNGEFFSVEHGKTDSGGQTTLHFVTEDVIYKANVFQDGVLVYTSGEFQAICQTSPCQINLRKPYDNSEGISFLSNIYYDISSQYDFYNSKQIVFDFSTTDGTSTNIQMVVTKSTTQFNETICSSSKTLSSGSIVCLILPTFYNATYTARIYKDGEFLGWRTYTLEPNADDTFGRTGVFLAGLGYLMLSFMAISSAIVSIVLGIVGLMAMISMNLLIGGSFFGIGSTFIWLIIAGGILVWKYAQRRVQ